MAPKARKKRQSSNDELKKSNSTGYQLNIFNHTTHHHGHIIGANNLANSTARDVLPASSLPSSSPTITIKPKSFLATTISELLNEEEYGNEISTTTKATPRVRGRGKSRISTTTADSVIKDLSLKNDTSWGLITVLIIVAIIIVGLCLFCIKRFFAKKRSKDKKGAKGGDMKNVQLLGAANKDKLQGELDELTENIEEPDEGKAKEVEKLGKLQFKV